LSPDEFGNLYIVATPIGNLGDITFRAIEVLKTVDLIASEDTRRTSILLKHYGIATKMSAYHDHNKERVSAGIVDKLMSGLDIAVVSDAGTPGISDPGFYIIRLCLQNKISVIPIPGASSLLSAVVAAGLPTDRICFEGFLPRTSGKLKKRLESLIDDPRTIVFFESQHRIAKTLAAMSDVFGERPAYVGRELTKKFEEHIYGSLSELTERFQISKPKGEIVVVVAGYGKKLAE